MKIERRTFQAELRKDAPPADGAACPARKISGVAIVFSRLSENLGGYREMIDPAALDGCDMTDVRCLINHQEGMILGRTKSGTLTLSTDSAGLSFECQPPDTSYACDLMACMDRGDIDQCSFSFTVPLGGCDWSEDPETGAEIRTVKKIARLFDVSVVTYPAYPQTSTEIRSNADILSEHTPPTVSLSGGVDPLLRHKTDLAFYQQ